MMDPQRGLELRAWRGIGTEKPKHPYKRKKPAKREKRGGVGFFLKN